jgi:hypothetical protein
MFIQVVRGKVKDAEAMRNASETWQRELRPGAKGWLGATAGVADDGTFIAVVRFESQEAAQANSDRAEQSAWWEETSKLFDGAPTFYDCQTVDVWGSPSDEAGFVQVMIGKTNDVPGMREMGTLFEKEMSGVRTDVLGTSDAYTNNGNFVSTIYFTNEADARAGEKKMESDPAVQGMMEKFGHLFEGETTYIDIRDPWLH